MNDQRSTFEVMSPTTMSLVWDEVQHINPELDLESFLMATEWMDPLPQLPTQVTRSNTSDVTTQHRVVTTGNVTTKEEAPELLEMPFVSPAAASSKKQQRASKYQPQLQPAASGAAQSGCSQPFAGRPVSKRRSSKADMSGGAPTSQMRTLEQQIDAYKEQLADLMRTNLHLKEREILMEEMCAFRTGQESYFRVNYFNLPADSGDTSTPCGVSPALSPNSYDAGMLGWALQPSLAAAARRGGGQCTEADAPLGDPLLLGTREAAEAMAMLSFADLGVHYPKMVHQVSMLLVQSETNACAKEQLDLAMSNVHFFFQRLAHQNEDGCNWFGRRIDDPCSEALIPDAKAESMLRSLKLSQKQVERITDLVAIIQPRLEALDVERKRLIGKLHSATSATTPPTSSRGPSSPVGATSSSSTTGSGSLGGTAGGTIGGTAASGTASFGAASTDDGGSAEVADDVAERILSLGLYHGTDGDEMVAELHHSGVCTKDFISLMAGFTCVKILSAEQCARFMVHSYPWLPDCPALVHLATHHAGACRAPVLFDCSSVTYPAKPGP